MNDRSAAPTTDNPPLPGQQLAPEAERLVVDHVGLARHVASRFTNRGEPYEDLVQVASLALVKAAQRFDDDRGVQFATFAVTYMVGELKRHFRDRAWAVKAPRRLQELCLELARSIDRLSQDLGRAPTVGELAHALNVTDGAVLEALEAGRAYRTSSLDEPDQEGHPLAEQLGAPDPEFDHVEDRSVLSEALRQLPGRDQLIVRMRFIEGLTQSEIGARLGLSQMQISRLLASSVERLRSSFHESQALNEGSTLIEGSGAQPSPA
jgi:RNA polymerase sigma-B factor